MIAAALILALVRFFWAPADQLLMLIDWALLLAGLSRLVFGGVHDSAAE